MGNTACGDPPALAPEDESAYIPVVEDPTGLLIEMALAEDIGGGDVTSNYFIPADRRARARIVARKDGVVSGTDVARRVFAAVDPSLGVTVHLPDGSPVSPGTPVITITGSARSILTAERTALNFLQRLSGVATATAHVAALIHDFPTELLDTRKTTPGYRFLEKKAVLDGGGRNHRMGLYDRAMVKDNHLVAEGGLDALQAAILRLKSERPEVEVELEADRLDQVEAFLSLSGVDYILLDNMPPDLMRRAVDLRGTRTIPRFEASGNVNPGTVREIASCGVDFISMGALTHSAPALDLGMDFEPVES